MSFLIRTTKAQCQVCAFRDVYAIEIGNTVNSNTDYKGTVSSVRITEMSMLIEIRNTVNSSCFFNTAQYQVGALQWCLC